MVNYACCTLGQSLESMIEYLHTVAYIYILLFRAFYKRKGCQKTEEIRMEEKKFLKPRMFIVYIPFIAHQMRVLIFKGCKFHKRQVWKIFAVYFLLIIKLNTLCFLKHYTFSRMNILWLTDVQ